MNSDDVDHRKQKLSNIIMKITESQLLKIREADNNACSRQDCTFNMNPQERDNEMTKAMSIKLLNEKGHLGGPGAKGEAAESTAEQPGALPKHVGL